ncbi:MAG: 1-acyl-sn-glycerol-3-phosphate acyltransferase [Candidatus Obscuribacterales bacterium]|nr:1-acyl-sn-glycerol-3-phosphate acyltransferase [Candidatus Obscuribacterales bacterium]
MPVEYDPNAFSPFRTAIYMATARYFFGSIFWYQNKLEFSGRENIPEGPCVFVSNHLSNWDPPLVSRVVDRPVSYLAKKELYSDKFFRNLVLAYGAISIDRERPEKSTFKAVKEMLSKGWCLGMFIEGTRSKTPGILGQPNMGPAYFAKTNKLPLVPVGIVGTNIKRGKVIVKIGKPIQAEGSLDEISWKVMAALSELTGFQLPPKELKDNADTAQIKE